MPWSQRRRYSKKKPGKILEKLEEYFAPSRNVLYERYLFHSAQQQANDQYIIRLRHLAENCKFGALHDEMLHDCLVLGCRDEGARARLFCKKECSLKKALEALQISETTHEQLRDIEGEDSPVSAVHYKKSTKKAVQSSRKYCGGKRKPSRNKCPAYGKTCRKCGKPNHFHTVCLRGKVGTRQISVVEELESELSESDDELFVVE